ncbi:sce7725 family protein [Bifidobacterium sp. ESL0775]|uniref:sce7725 family protein n=1 Tax=Bifidobacterium sp. ESL0775 TaxID=2983230 RepID=UPI0023F8844A|nr:sce7725 family protein [Bifidobacterium sp. ESL0775]WEV69081.1 sce7725 family protein [Bifidobacterium sp. ESL0775]
MSGCYYPYLYGRQSELYALRNLAEEDRISDNVLPIVEPVSNSKVSIYLLRSVIETFRKHDLHIGVVINPVEGISTPSLLRLVGLRGNRSVVPVIVLSEDASDNLETVKEYKFYNPYIVVAREGRYQLQDGSLPQIQGLRAINFSVLLYEGGNAVKQDVLGSQMALQGFNNFSRAALTDHFHKLPRNVDYSEHPDEMFSRDHLFYRNFGDNGFGDYSVIGEERPSGGFAAYAVVIHWVYFDNNQVLRIHHYVSDSNEDFRDPGKKFDQAVWKLVNDNKAMTTFAADRFRYYLENGLFPGLAMIKRLSIMHHLELMNAFLNSAEE